MLPSYSETLIFLPTPCTPTSVGPLHRDREIPTGLELFLAFYSTGPQWLKQVSLISHKHVIGELKSPSKSGSTLALQ